MPGEAVGEVTQVEDLGLDVEVLVRSGSRIKMKSLAPEKRGEIIHSFMSGMVSAARQKDMAWLKLGMYWSFLVKNKLYRYCGEHINNANDFLRDADLGVSRRELERYALMAEMFGRAMRERNIEIPLRKLNMIAPLCHGIEAEEWLEKAIALPSAALEDEIRASRGLPTRDTCPHPEDHVEVWTRCTVCGKWVEKIQDAR